MIDATTSRLQLSVTRRIAFAHIIDGKQIAKERESSLAEQVQLIKSKFGVKPKLTTILVGEDPASQVYIKHKHDVCERVGIDAEHIGLPANTSEAELLAMIHQLNHDPKTNGILVQLPLPEHIDKDKIINALDPLKDVDGFHPLNLGHLFQGKPRLRPCTPYGIMHLFEHLNIDLKGKHAVMIGSSAIVGRPMAGELLIAGCTVTICHRLTQNLRDEVARGDIVISATGIKHLVQADWVKTGAIVIDVGIIRLPNGKLTGDVDFDAIKEKASYITPVPGGVGPMTVVTLMQNTIEAFWLQHAKPY